jgi:branched-chain amino acid transport system ATP-binding protein
MLDLRGIDAFYGDSHILQGIHLKLPERGRVAVLGRNGAGKSTLLKSIMNAGPRVSGDIYFEGMHLAQFAPYVRARMGLALVPEDRRIYAHLCVLENLKLAEQALPAGRNALPMTQLLQHFPMLEPLQARFGNQLSGGQQQMLAVARGVAARPKLLLLDEPTEGLAPVIVEQLARSVAEICRQFGIGLLLCEQNLWFARKCTDYLYILDAGRVAFEGDWASLDRNPDIKTKYLAV